MNNWNLVYTKYLTRHHLDDFYTINTAFPVSDKYVDTKSGRVLLWGEASVPTVASGADSLVGTIPNAGEPSAMTPSQISGSIISDSVSPEYSDTDGALRRFAAHSAFGDLGDTFTQECIESRAAVDAGVLQQAF